MTAQQSGELGLASTVATRARGLLAERQMKQAELGLAMGITRSRINDRLNGAKDFDIDELPALASALGTSIEYLMGLTDVRESKNPRPGDQDGGDSVRHQGLEPRTRWLRACPPEPAAVAPLLRLIPGPIPAEEEPAEQPATALAEVLPFRVRKAS